MAYGRDGFTVGEVISGGGALEWRCPECGGVGRADLPRMAEALGEDFYLVDQHPPCRASPGCLGRVNFYVGLGMRWMRQESPRASRWRLEAWNYREARSLEAHGWRIAGGLWRPPHRLSKGAVLTLVKRP